MSRRLPFRVRDRSPGLSMNILESSMQADGSAPQVLLVRRAGASKFFCGGHPCPPCFVTVTTRAINAPNDRPFRAASARALRACRAGVHPASPGTLRLPPCLPPVPCVDQFRDRSLAQARVACQSARLRLRQPRRSRLIERLPERSRASSRRMTVPAMGHDPVRGFALNPRGRDVVVGDVHGCFRTLDRGLSGIGFDPHADRLFGVGDLVNRGPHSAEALGWLERRFDAVVLGNHDRSVLSWLRARRRTKPPAGSEWLLDLPRRDHSRWRAALGSMPLAITIRTAHGLVGIVRAEAPHRSWCESLRLLRTASAFGR